MESVSLQLAPEEPEAAPWRVELLSTVIEAVTRGEPGKVVAARPVVLAVDGRSNSGKTTLALRMAEEIPFNAAQRSWERADIVVCGTLEIPYDPVREIVVGPPPGRASA